MAVSPGVTTVIPTHNRPELMTVALRSVLEQEYDGPVEVVVVFDACTPFRPDVEVPAHCTLRTTENKRSRGLAGARNTGIDLASHDFVAFLDDDDAWLPGKLAAQMEVFADRPSTVLVGTAMLVDDGVRTHERLTPTDLARHQDLLRDRMAGLHSSTFVFRTDALRGEIGMVDEALPGSYGEDYDLLLRTAKVAPVAVVNRPLVRVSWQGQSFFFGKWQQYADGLTYLLEQHPEFETERRSAGRIKSQIAFARASSGRRREAIGWALRALRNDPTQVKAYLALGIAARLLSSPWVVRTVQRFGRGI